MKRRWTAAAMGAILVGILVAGVVCARPDQSAQAADATRKLTIPAAFFHPRDPTCYYWNNGNYIWTDSNGGSFTAPVVFPCIPSVTVERITLSVRDQNVCGDAGVSLYRTKPNKGTQKMMASVCSTGSQPDVVNYTSDTIDHPLVWPSQGPYLLLSITGESVTVYGVQIEYKRNT
jgi:hypothetical protein